VLWGWELVLTDEATPLEAEVTVDSVDGVVYGGLVRTLELELRDVKAPEFAVVLLGKLDVGGV
jgi:hypothetical protein